MKAFVRLQWAFAPLAALGMVGCDADSTNRDAPPVSETETEADSDRGTDINVNGSEVDVETEGEKSSGVNIDVRPDATGADGPDINIRIPDPNKPE